MNLDLHKILFRYPDNPVLPLTGAASGSSKNGPPGFISRQCGNQEYWNGRMATSDIIKRCHP